MVYLLLDLEGTLYTREGVIPGAVEVVTDLRKLTNGIRFLTNTDSQSNDSLLDFLATLGLVINPDELFTPVDAAIAQIVTQPNSQAFVIGTPMVIKQLSAAVTVTENPDHATHLIVGDCRTSLDYALLDSAFRALCIGAEFIALQRGRFFLSAGRPHLDTGAIIAALEYAAQREARVVGKPATEFLDAAVRSFSFPPAPADVWVVGDDATTDIAMGCSYGAVTVQVRTGKFGLGHSSTASYVIESITALPNLLRR